MEKIQNQQPDGMEGNRIIYNKNINNFSIILTSTKKQQITNTTTTTTTTTTTNNNNNNNNNNRARNIAYW